MTGLGYLGRLPRGCELPVVVRCLDAAGDPAWPADNPVLTVYGPDGSTVESRRLPADLQGELVGLFRYGLFLGTPYATPGRHGLVARYATAGGDPVALAGHFYLLPGGSADGAVTALRPVRRPEAEYVLYSTDGGVLARGRNPR